MTISGARLLFMAGALFALAGVALRLAPVHLELDPIPPVTAVEMTAVPNALEQAEALLSHQEIIDANIFSRNRTPPATRYVPPELVPDTAPAQTQTRSIHALRLFGVAVGPTGAVALIDADPRIPGAEVYRLGDAVGDAVLAAIEDTAVVLEGPRGRTRLRLPSSSRR